MDDALRGLFLDQCSRRMGWGWGCHLHLTDNTWVLNIRAIVWSSSATELMCVFTFHGQISKQLHYNFKKASESKVKPKMHPSRSNYQILISQSVYDDPHYSCVLKHGFCDNHKNNQDRCDFIRILAEEKGVCSSWFVLNVNGVVKKRKIRWSEPFYRCTFTS